MVNNQIVHQQVIYFQDTTTNQSFMDMHYLLRAKNIKNDKFFLAIYDPGLMGVDPRDPNISREMAVRILRECTINFWYFIREIVRIPVEGGAVDGGARYKLHRGNLAMNYLFVHNYDMFVDLPRQHFKTISALVWYLWVYNFGSSNTNMMFINMKHEYAKDNLKKMKNIRAALPEFLQMDALFDRDGNRIKTPNTVETMQHPANHNVIKTLPAARSKSQAEGAGRGCTMAIQYYDEFAFMPYNETIYTAAQPAYSRARINAKENNAPYGMLITTTPGDLTTDEGIFANEKRLNATPWCDEYYNLNFQELEDLRNSNDNSTFFYIRYTYQQLGSGADYFEAQIKGLEKNWPKIRREVLIEWSAGSMNCPFSQQDLDTIEALCRKDPIKTLFFGKSGQYQLHLWDQIPFGSQYPPIIGVDVAAGWQKDSSAITIIDSQTTRVIATLNCNYIPSQDLAQVIFDIVTQYMKSAIVNIEQNGGFGASVLQLLIKSKIKKNLYYEIKDQVKEERTDGIKTIYKKQKVKSFGSVSTHETRNKLIELLHQRVKYHKDKFIAPILLAELKTMEVKKNGKTEHASNAHDDQIFSYLWALYVWYYGEDLMERFHIFKTEIKTDQYDDETTFSLEERYGGMFEIDPQNFNTDSEVGDLIENQNTYLNQAKSMSLEEFNIEQVRKEQEALNHILSTKDGRRAVSKAWNTDINYLDEQYGGNNTVDLGNDILDAFYGTDSRKDKYEGNMADMFRNLK